jgi:hypothetical protein
MSNVTCLTPEDEPFQREKEKLIYEDDVIKKTKYRFRFYREQVGDGIVYADNLKEAQEFAEQGDYEMHNKMNVGWEVFNVEEAK